MPILAIRRSRSRHGRNDLLQGLPALGVPEPDLVGREVLLLSVSLSSLSFAASFQGEKTHNLISNIMPHARLPLRLPLRVLTSHPLQVRVRRPALATQPPVLQLRKVALKETDLVLPVHARRVRVLPHDREVVPHFPLCDRGLGLRYELDAPHVLPVPEGRRVQGKLGALC